MAKVKERCTEKVQSMFTKSELELLEEFAEENGDLSLSKTVSFLAIKSSKNQ